MISDVPSPIDLREMSDARAWASTALQKQPTRPDFFRTFAAAISNHPAAIKRVLELGSGPGFLAEHLLNEFPQISYVALDFSNAMHALARARLGVNAVRVSFIERSFKAMDWTRDLGSFDCVVTHQAVHELRNKRHAAEHSSECSNALTTRWCLSCLRSLRWQRGYDQF